jgi:hypothetical protein
MLLDSGLPRRLKAPRNDGCVYTSLRGALATRANQKKLKKTY